MRESSGPSAKIMFIAYLQVIAIILVVLYHSFHEYPGGNFGFDLWGMRLLATLRMPIFLFISGYLMVITTRRKNPGWGEYAVKKVKRLMIPFLTLSIVTFIPRSMMSSIADEQIVLSPESLLGSLTRSEKMVIPFFWYLQASLVLLCGTYLLTLLARRLRVAPVAVYLLFFFIFLAVRAADIVDTDFFSLHSIFRYGANFFLGAAYACLPADKDRLIPWTSPLFTVGAAILWVVCFLLFEGHPYLYELATIASFLTFISLTKILEERKIGILDRFVGANYMIFLLSWYFNILSQQVLHHFIPSLPWQICSALSLLLGVGCPLMMYKYLQRHKHSRWGKITSFLLGQ